MESKHFEAQCLKTTMQIELIIPSQGDNISPPQAAQFKVSFRPNH